MTAPLRTLTVGALMLPTTPVSIRVYVDEIASRLGAHGIHTVRFDHPGAAPACDVLWDPRTGGGRAPAAELLGRGTPLVATLHDVAHLALPAWEFHSSLRDAWNGLFDARRVRRAWRHAQAQTARLIVPSVVTMEEAVHHLGLRRGAMTVVPHGVDHGRFGGGARVPVPEADGEPYFLHISQFQRRKNIARLLAAYASLPRPGRPRLVMKVIGYPGRRDIDGATFIDREMSRDEIAALYRGALAFVFPSVSEGFGMPILEAMASACTVITSAGTACGEVAGNAALLVDPYSVPSIAQAMQTAWQDPSRRHALAEAGRLHAAGFTWERAAALHAQTIRAVADRQ